MQIKREFNRIRNAATNFGYSVSDSFEGLFAKDPLDHAIKMRDLAETRQETRAEAERLADEIAILRKDTFVVIEESRGFGGFLKKCASAIVTPAIWMAKQPVALAMKPVRWTLNGGTALFTHFPKAAPIAAVVGTAVAGGTWFAKRESKKLQTQSDAIGQMQAAQSQYMNNPEASQAFVDARMAADREQGVASSSKADAVMAARQSVPAPEAASAAGF